MPFAPYSPVMSGVVIHVNRVLLLAVAKPAHLFSPALQIF